MLFKKFYSIIFKDELSKLPSGKLLINTINAYSFVTARNHGQFQEALLKCDVLLPDGIGVVFASRLFGKSKVKKIAGEDLFFWEMDRLEKFGGKVFFLGSSNSTLEKISVRLKRDFPNVSAGFYSPPYKQAFTEEETNAMINSINQFAPDVLFIGMTAPKQEVWAYKNYKKLKANHICSIGAVFDFYGGTVKRSPIWLINLGMEWFYRLIKEPKRLWKRYLIGNAKFIFFILTERGDYDVRRTLNVIKNFSNF